MEGGVLLSKSTSNNSINFFLLRKVQNVGCDRLAPSGHRA